METTQHINVLSNHKTHNWSGGTTTELFIHPLNANFKDLNFDFRLSTATVEIDTSNFTALPYISRTLMVLEGNMTLHHKNHHSKQLRKFDIDHFEGDWNSKSVGKCIDFNLMTTGKVKGILEGYSLNEKEEQTFLVDCDFLCIYLFKGQLSYNSNEKTNVIHQGNLIYSINSLSSEIQVEAIENSEIVVCRIVL